MTDTAASPWPKRLRLIGVLVLLIGAVSAGVVYHLGTRANEHTDDMSMVGYGRAQARQMGVMYGKMGSVIEDFSDDLKQPGNQAALIVVASIVIAVVCFHFSRPLDRDEETTEK